MNTAERDFVMLFKQIHWNNQDIEWVNKIIQQYDNDPIIKQTDQDKCPSCKIEMEIYEHNKFRWCCPECGRIVDRCDLPNLYNSPNGGVFESKKQTYNHAKHFIDWMNHILAKEIPGKFEESLNTIRNHIMQNNIKEISLESLRNTLKRLKLSKHYKHTSFYFKSLTNIGPPNIPDQLIQQAKFMFRDWTKAKEFKIEGLRPNNPSYPYMIYKIFDIILPPDDVENRRIFHFIHLPSEATLKKREEEWKLVYEKIKHIYKPDIH